MKAAILAGIIVVSASVTAHGVVIDFDTFPGPDGKLETGDDIPVSAPLQFSEQLQQLTTQYSSVGILFLPNPPLDDKNEILNDQSFFRTAGSPRNLLSTSVTAFPFGPVEARFTVTIYELTMAIGQAGGSSKTNRIEIFNADGAILGSIVGTDQFVTLNSLVPIARFRVSGLDSSSQASIDDIEFTPIAEPHSALLGSMALWAMATLSHVQSRRLSSHARGSGCAQ